MSYQIRWVLRGGARGIGRAEATETFTGKSRALAFAAEVEDAGHDWPMKEDGVRSQRGSGYVSTNVEADSSPPT